MASEARKRKLAKDFHAADLNDDGRIGPEDLEQLARRACEEFGYTAGSAQHRAMYDANMDYLTAMQKHVDTDDDGRISEDEYVNFWLAAGEDEARSILRPWVDKFFSFVDTDGDGALTQREFERYYRATGVDADAATVFSELDADGSGSLSKDELTEYIVDFMLSETSDSRGSVLLGTG